MFKGSLETFNEGIFCENNDNEDMHSSSAPSNIYDTGGNVIPSPSLENLSIETSTGQTETRLKKYAKKYNACKFCQKKNQNIDRHLQQVHKNEPEVKRFMSLPKSIFC